MITNYCWQVAKYCFLSRLLLSAIVAGFVLPSHASCLPNPALGQTINVVTIHVIAKASKQVLPQIRGSQHDSHFLVGLRSVDRSHHTQYDLLPSQPHKLKSPFLVANTIRAGPEFTG